MRPRGPSRRSQRNRPNRADVDRHVLAARSVTARRAADEPPVLVGQGDAEAVDLHLRDVVHPLVAEAAALPDALVERPQLVLVVGVVQAEHGHLVLDRGEALGDAPAHALCRRIRRDEAWMRRLEPFELMQQVVEFLVGNLRRALNVVELFVAPNQLPKVVDAGGSVAWSVHGCRDARSRSAIAG